MSNVVRFLETMGANPAVMLSAAKYAEAVMALDADADQQQALLDRDHAALNELLDGRTKMFCFIVAPDDQESESTPDDRDGDGVPDQEGPASE